MLSLRAFLTDRLMAAADEIFVAVEKTVAEYKEEIFRSKDLEISRLRMQLKLLKSEPELERCIGDQLQQHTHHHHHPPPPPPQHHQPSPAVEEGPEPQPCEEDEGSSMEQEHIEPSEVKKEQHHKSHGDFWMGQEAAEQLESLESNMKDFISPPSSMRNSLHDAILPFNPNHNNIINISSAGEKPYCCSVCEKRFSNCSHLAAHIRTHTGERPYICDICRKTFITTSALNRHQTIHTEGKQYVCNYCGKSFKWMESLGRHVRSLHKRENMPV